MKFILSFCLFCGIALSSFAQSGNQQPFLNIGLDVAFPLGNYSNLYSSGIGGSLKCEVPVSKKAFFTVSAGYERFSYTSMFKQEFNPANSGAGYVPLKGGLKYYAGSNFFAEGQFGIAISTLNNGGTMVAYSPGIGYTFINGVEAGLRYEAWSKDGTFNQIALRLGYRFQ